MTALTPAALLRDPHTIYRADTGICVGGALLLIALAEPLSQLLGWPLPSAHLTAAGIFLLFWAACNYAIGKIARPAPALVWLNIAGDCSWVLASIALAAVHASTLTPLGMALLLGQASGVGLVIATKLAGVARMTHPLSA